MSNHVGRLFRRVAVSTGLFCVLLAELAIARFSPACKKVAAPLMCWWFGCRPDHHAMDYCCDAVPCERCGAADTSYSDQIGDTRHNRCKAWCSWWLWHRWLPKKCPACGGRAGCRADCDGIPF